MRKEDMNIAIGIAGLAAAILLFGGGKGAADSGYGGAFPLPLVMQSPGAVEPTQTLSGAQGLATPTPGQTSNPFSEWGLSFTESARGTIGATQGSVDTFLGGVSTTKKSVVSLPAWMGGEDYVRNVNKLRSEGYSYVGADPTGAFTFSKTIETKKEAAVASSSGYGGIAAVPGGSAGVSGYRSGGTGTWTSAGYTTRY